MTTARGALALLALALFAPAVQAQFVSYTGAPLPPETFSALASVPPTGTTIPNGWFYAENNVAGSAYGVSDGSGASLPGDTYSFGTSASAERAFGAIASGSVVSKIGVRIRNDTGSTLNALDVGFTGEQWRLGDLNGSDKLDFQYCTSSCAVTDVANAPNWTNLDALDFVSPVTTGTAVSALDGNDPANRTVKSAPLLGLALANGAELWLRWVDVNDGGVDDGLAIDDVQIGPAADFPPTVASTVPANGAGSVTATTNLTINFSEPVNASGAWYSLECATSGAHPALVSGGPQSYVLDPTTSFTPGEECTGTIVAAQIVDLDGTADVMAADYAFTFDVAPDLVPTVTSTAPADGAVNVALGANVVVTFSEPVNAPAGAFSISCDDSGAHPFALTGGPSAYTLNPDADFQLLEDCDVAIAAGQVFDLDGGPDAVAAYAFTFETTGGAANYYASVNASNPTVLRTTLHARIRDHTAFPYSSGTATDTNDILDAADQNPLVPSEVLEVYQNDHHPKAGGGNPNYNKEHTWPNSYGFNDLDGAPGNVPESSAFSDTHMLYLSDVGFNSNRGSKPFADCAQASGCTVDATLAYNGFGGGPTTYPGNHNWKKPGADGTNGCSAASFSCEAYGSYEVWNHRRGDIARAVLYMDIRYEGGQATAGNTAGQFEPQLIVTDDRDLIYAARSSGSTTSSTTAYMGLKSVLVDWHTADPPDAQELLRNDLIFSFQGNRNPFIDHPEWVDCLFVTPPVCNAAPPDLMFGNGFED